MAFPILKFLSVVIKQFSKPSQRIVFMALKIDSKVDNQEQNDLYMGTKILQNIGNYQNKINLIVRRQQFEMEGGLSEINNLPNYTAVKDGFDIIFDSIVFQITCQLLQYEYKVSVIAKEKEKKEDLERISRTENKFDLIEHEINNISQMIKDQSNLIDENNKNINSKIKFLEMELNKLNIDIKYLKKTHDKKSIQI